MRQAGYTLIELLLYVAIVGVLLTSVTAFLGLVVDARVKNQTINEVNDQGTAIMDYLTETVHNATSITTPASAGNGTSLTLTVPTTGLSPTTFNLSGTTLQVIEGSNSPVALTNSRVQMTNLTFKNLTLSGTNGIVQISFTIQGTNPNNRSEYNYQKTFTSSAGIAW